jgi:hypothetical protein
LQCYQVNLSQEPKIKLDVMLHRNETKRTQSQDPQETITSAAHCAPAGARRAVAARPLVVDASRA